MEKIVLITQARMGSIRLPGKVLKEVLGKPLLFYHLERLQRAKRVVQVIVATTRLSQDDVIVERCKGLGVAVYRGSSDDVLERYTEAAQGCSADLIVRCTSDCPLIDPVRIDQVIEYYQTGDYDYVSNSLERTFPRGMDTEVFSLKALEKIAKLAVEPYDREHVTPYFWRHPEKYRLGSVRLPVNLSHYRWTVDTSEDLVLIEKILGALYPKNPHFTFEDMITLLEKHPDWAKINAHVQQKA